MGATLKRFSLAFVAMLLMAGAVWASTATYTTPASNTEVGGLPLCVTATGTSTASTATALTITLPAGFDAETVLFVSDYDATNSDKFEWRKGIADSSIIVTTGSSGNRTFSTVASANIDSDAGTILIGVDIQIASGNWIMRACR